MDSLQIREFASQLKPIIDFVDKKQLEQQSKRERGELFNVFEAFRIDHSELAWSSFLATLLDPNGCHGCGDVFLKAFPFLPTGFDHTKVTEITPEKGIGKLDKVNKESGGRIDIFVQDTNGNTLIIENKIYAGDQENQLYRYWKHAVSGKDNITNFQLVYLTLNGHKPSPFSTENEKKSIIKDTDYICMSYSQDIKRWLETCLKEISGKTKVAEIIKQFIKTIENTSKEMKIDEEIKIAIEDGFNMDDNIDNKIKNLKSILKGLPEVTNNINLLLEQYQQEKFVEIMHGLPSCKNIKVEGKLNSYWCCRAYIKDEEININQIFVMHDWPQAMYCGVIFSKFDPELWNDIKEKCKMYEDKNNNLSLLNSIGLNDYDSAIKKLQEILDYIIRCLKLNKK